MKLLGGESLLRAKGLKYDPPSWYILSCSGVLRMQKLPSNPPTHSGNPGLSKGPSFETWSRSIALHSMICLLPGRLACSSSAFLVHFTSFSPKPLQRQTGKCLELWKDFGLVIRWLVFCPDISKMVDWVLIINDLLIYLPTYLPTYLPCTVLYVQTRKK